MRGLGFARDTVATHDGSATPLLRAALRGCSDTIRPVDFLTAIGGVGDQGQTESCVGWTFVEVVALRARALGLDLPRGSELGVWALARQLAGQAEGFTQRYLHDEGAQPSLAVRGLREYGMPSQASLPWDPSGVTKKVSLGMLEAADATVPLLVHGFFGITTSGEEKLDEITAALRTGHPVAIAVCASTSEFQNAGPTTPPLPAWDQSLAPDHMVSLVDYDTDGNFLLLNHWGASWGNGGLAWVSSAFVAGAADLFVVDVGAKS